MTSPSLLIIGCGDLGIRAGTALANEDWRIDAVRRTPDGQTSLFNWFAADYSDPESLRFVQGLKPDFILATLSPTSRDLPGYQSGFPGAAQALLDGLGQHRAKQLIMTSSTRVYREANGGWVDEHAALATTDKRALAIIEAERLFLQSDQPTSIVRLAGIYGAPGGRLVSRIARGEISTAEPPRYTNRIHREDCDGFLVHLLKAAARGEALAEVYNGVDDTPATAFEVESWIADQLDVQPRNHIAISQGNGTNHKRVSNRLMHSSGYQLKYPDYRSGYAAVLSSGQQT
jgi:nucleoside-diphosphate-sugar epimerase